ncbi:MAG: TolC family protein [Thermodesulfovibrionia bacterium]|nr:TolC family protein [Thermodesulfovibrionia bacterium]
MKKYYCSLILIITLMLPLSAIADETKVLTLQQALDIASEKNLDIQKAREYSRWVQGKYVEERAAALPHFSVTGSALLSQDDTGFYPDRMRSYSGEVGVTQTLFTWGKLGAAIRAAKEGLKTADEQLRLYRQAALRDVSIAFYDVLFAKELHAISLQNLEQKERHLEEAQRKYSAGVATDYEVLAAEVAVQNARPDSIRTENRIREALDRLRFLLASEDKSIDVTGSLEPVDVPTVLDYEAVYSKALENRPEVKDLRFRINIAGELVTMANSEDKPQLEFRGGYGWKDLNSRNMDMNGNAWSAGMFLSFPFFDGMHTSGKVTQAESDLRSIKIDEEKLANSIALQTRQALNNVQESKEIVDALSGTVKQAEKLLFMSEKGYELGVKIRLEVEDAELNLRQAKVNLSQAWRDYLASQVNLLWVMGVLGEN